MNTWLRRIRGVVGMGLTWALGGLGVAAVIEGADNITPGGIPAIHVIDMWPPFLLVAGFVGGIVFGTLVGIVGARRRYDQFSLGGFTALGAATGLLLGGFVVATGGPTLVTVVALVSGTIGGAASLAVARLAERRGLLHGGVNGAAMPLPKEEDLEELGPGREKTISL